MFKANVEKCGGKSQQYSTFFSSLTSCNPAGGPRPWCFLFLKNKKKKNVASVVNFFFNNLKKASEKLTCSKCTHLPKTYAYCSTVITSYSNYVSVLLIGQFCPFVFFRLSSEATGLAAN